MSRADERVLVFAPYGREGQLTSQVLAGAGFDCEICGDLRAFVAALEEGAGAAVVTEEALTAVTIAALAKFLKAQPAWSDLPLLLFVARADETSEAFTAVEFLWRRSSTTVLERPIRTATMITLVQTALRARRRQYELRDMLAGLGARVDAATEELGTANELLREEVRAHEAAESERVRLEKRFSKVFFASPLPITIATLDGGRYLEINQSALSLLGYEREDVIDRSVRHVGLWDQRSPIARDDVILQLEKGESLRDVEIRVCTKSGELRVALAAFELIEFMGDPCLLSMFVDITERDRTEGQLKQAIEKVMQNAAWFSHQVMEELVHLKSGQLEFPEPTDLTDRERQVLERIAVAKSNEEISAELNLAEQTVRNYITNIYGKIGVHSRVEAVVWARKRGL